MEDNPYVAPRDGPGDSPRQSRHLFRILFETFAGLLVQSVVILVFTTASVFSRLLREDSMSFAVCLVLPSFVGGLFIAKRSFDYPKVASALGLSSVAFAIATMIAIEAGKFVPFVAAASVAAAAWSGAAIGTSRPFLQKNKE